jgi:trimethylamine--corrinoid protein Co-methyltransferase
VKKGGYFFMSNNKHLRLTVLSEEQIKSLHEATVDVLENTGVIVDTPEAVDLLNENGARVKGNNVCLPAALLNSALKTAPDRIFLYDRKGEKCLEVGGDNVYFGGWVENLYIYDPENGSLRPPVLDDLEYTASVCDRAANIDWLSWAGQVSDVPPPIRDSMIFRKILNYTVKPYVTTTTDENALKDIIDMAAVVAGGYEKLKAKPFIANASEPVSPLHLSNTGVKKLLMCAEYGIPICYYPMPAAGSTAPCFPAGPLVIGNAEVLAGLVIHQLSSPGAPFIYGNIPGMMDMRTTVVSYGAPELILCLSAIADLGHWYNLPVYGTAGCGDSMEIDGQLGAEYALTIQNALLSRANLVHDPGILGAGVLGGAEAIVFADEIIGMAKHITCGIEISPRSLAVDTIHEIGPRGNYLTHESTVTNYRSFWYPNAFIREPAQVWLNKKDKPDLRARLRSRADKLVGGHITPPLKKDVEADLKKLEIEIKKRV